jgi:hypothetical protein
MLYSPHNEPICIEDQTTITQLIAVMWVEHGSNRLSLEKENYFVMKCHEMRIAHKVFGRKPQAKGPLER